MTRRRLALYLSRLFHPFVISPVALWLALRLTTESTTAWRWTGGVLLITVLPATMFILWQVRRGHFGDRDVSLREQRGALYRLALAEIGILLLLLYAFAAPPVIFAATYGILLALGCAGVINHFWTKISIHTLVASGSALLFLPLVPAVTILFGLAAAAVAWSRLVLGHHTVGQVLLGAGVATLSTTLMLAWFGFW